MNKVELKEIIGGGLQEQFGKAFEEVVENLQNPNTPYKNSREITIKFKFVQNEQRDDVKCAVHVSTKLAPQSPMETAFAIGKDLRNGEVYAEEYGKNVKGQMSMEEIRPPKVVLGENVVDTETGEIIDEQPQGAIVNFRRAKTV